MDVVAAAASVGSLIQLSDRILEICGGYISKVKDAKGEILQLTQKIETLQKTLQALYNLLQDKKHAPYSIGAQELANDVTRCQSTFKGLKEKIDPVLPRNKTEMQKLRMLKWQLKRRKVVEANEAVNYY